MKKIMFNDNYFLTDKVLDGSKTMTRRIIPQKAILKYGVNRHTLKDKIHDLLSESPYKAGDIVAIAQSYQKTLRDIQDLPEFNNYTWEELQGKFQEEAGWNNKMFIKAELMPKTIIITDVRVESLQDISDKECLLEGIETNTLYKTGYPYGFQVPYNGKHMGSRYRWFSTQKNAFASLIDRISGKGTWENNPYVYVYQFTVLQDGTSK